MPEFNKSRGFKLKGFSYPGKSPLKGKKADRKAELEANRNLQQETMDKFKDMEIGQGGSMSEDGFSVNLPSPVSQTEEAAEEAAKEGATEEVVTEEGATEEVSDKAGSMSWGELGTGLAGKLGGELANVAINNMLSKKKEKKPVKKGPDTSGFNKIKFGN